MALKKSQIYASLWQSCDELRGGMDASQYKDYVLTLLFMKYVSDKAGRPDSLIEVPIGGGFADMAALKGDKEIGDHINKIIARLAEANDLKGVIDQADFNDESKLGTGKEMQDRLSKLVAIFEGLDFRANRAEGDDLLGDAYEYLMRHFATESGKAKGQFYTPAEVSRVMAQVIGIGPHTRQDQTIYDLARVRFRFSVAQSRRHRAARHQHLRSGNGQRHLGLGADEHDLARSRDRRVVARQHLGLALFITRPRTTGSRPSTLPSPIPRFPPRHGRMDSIRHMTNLAGSSTASPPAKNGDYAFLLHLIKSLKRGGKGAIILPHGVLFRGNKEADIRKNLVRRGFIKGIIGLPANLFYGTGIPACILVINRAGYSEARVETARVKAVILGHGEFKSYQQRVADVFKAWREAHKPRLWALAVNARPAEVIHDLSEDLLTRFAGLPLLNRYDAYQCLMDYWDETMQDDVYLISADGWLEAAEPRGIVEDKAKKIKETPDLTIKREKYKMDLIPPALIVARYFAADQAALDALRVAQEDAARELEEFVEERAGEGGLLEDVVNDKGTVTKTNAVNRLKALRDEPESDGERAALEHCLALFQAKSKSDKAAKDAQTELDEQTLKRYAALTETEIKTLVIERKWFADIQTMIDSEGQRLTQHLAARVKELEERYAQPLPELEREAAAFGDKVAGHLAKMGVTGINVVA